MSRITTTLLLICVLGSSVFSQITITKQDFDAMMRAKTALRYTATNALGSKMNLPLTGTGNTYDLSLFTYGLPDTSSLNTKDPSLTPYASDYPTATHAIVGPNFYMYFRVANDGYWALGIVSTVTGQEMKITYDPEELIMKFPATLGTSWTYEGKPYSMFPNATLQRSTSNSIIAAGTLKVPGKSAECLLLREVYVTTVVTDLGGTTSEVTSKSVSYSFITKQGLDADIDVDTLDENSSTPTLGGAGYTTYSSTPTAVEPSSIMRDTPVLSPAFPNPVTASGGSVSSVSWSSRAGEPASIQLYDLQGRLIRTLWEGAAPAGENVLGFGTSDLRNGTYLLLMQSGGQSIHRLMTVVK